MNAEDASFRDDESTRRYIDTAICKNIQHSLACCEDGGHFRHLRPLYEAGELTGAINRVIEDMTRKFLTSVLNRIYTESLIQKLMEALCVQQEQSVDITKAHVAEIKEYLTALDLIINCSIETAEPGTEPVEHILFTQPGMRYCQAQTLVHVLLKDKTFATLGEQEKKMITDRILEEVRGRMLEDIVLLETTKALSSRYKVCKLQFANGEFDMVIYDREENCCAAFEIKHSGEAVPEQARHLRDAEKCASVQRRFGVLVGKYVLYLGEEMDTGDGVMYRNAEGFLRNLPKISLRADITMDSNMARHGEGNLRLSM